MVKIKPDLIIFSDASCIEKENNRSEAGYGVVIVNPKTEKYTIMNGKLDDQPIAYAECYAILQSLRFIEHLRKKGTYGNKKLNILVVSDSLCTINAFRQYIPNNWDTSDWYNWKRSYDKPVVYQKLYRRVWKIICKKQYNVRFVHIRSHMRTKKKKHKELREYLRKQGLILNTRNFHVLMDMNDLADRVAYNTTINPYDASLDKLPIGV